MMAILIHLLFLFGPLYAADNMGNYAIWGKGNKSCFSYGKERNTDAHEAYKNYLKGYLTAYNTITPETYSISGKMNIDQITNWMDDYCDKNKMHGFEQALTEFIIRHYKGRFKTPPNRGGR